MKTVPPLADTAFERAAEVAKLVQGEVLAVPDACVILADAAAPLSERAAAEAEAAGVEEGLITVPHDVDLIVLVTQTCDLQQTSPEASLCQVAPVVQGVEPSFANQVARGRRPGWVALPWHDSCSVGDLSRITTVERSVIAGAETRGRPSNAGERLHFAEEASRHLTRVALPEPVSEVLRPVLTRIRDRHDRKSPEGQCITTVESIRVEADPDMDADRPDLTVLLVFETESLPPLPPGFEVRNEEVDALVAGGIDPAARAALAAADPRSRREAWQALAELWIHPAIEVAVLPESGVGSVDVEVLNADELSFARSRRAPELDLAYLTSRTA